MKPEQFRKRVETIFRDLNLIQYRECRESGFVEFWITSDEVPGPYIELKQLNRLAKLLRSDNFTVTGGDIGGHGCDRCMKEEPAVYVVVYDVRFK